MKVKMYTLIEQVVELGIEAGWYRAHKHTDTPTEGALKTSIAEYIMNGFDEAFKFDQEDMQ